MARILVIDDDAHIRTILRRMLTLEGHDVLEAPDGAAALEIQRQTPSDLVITDIFMPEKEGIATIMELKSDNPAIKIIAISGGARDKNLDFLELAKNVGAQRAFQKPFDREELITAINDLL